MGQSRPIHGCGCQFISYLIGVDFILNLSIYYTLTDMKWNILKWISKMAWQS